MINICEFNDSTGKLEVKVPHLANKTTFTFKVGVVVEGLPVNHSIKVTLEMVPATQDGIKQSETSSKLATSNLSKPLIVLILMASNAMSGVDAN